MAVALLGSNVFAFADGGSGHACAMGSAPAVGDLDVLFVNSDTTISTPSGFTTGTSNLNAQASAAFYRFAAGGESSSVTVTTSGNFNAEVQWSRWSGLSALDIVAKASTIGSSDTQSISATTATIGSSTALILAFAALHSIGAAADQNTPVWAGGYTALTGPNPQGTGSAGCNGFVGYKVPVGTAAESPSVSWSGNGVFDRDTLVMVFTAAAPPPGPTPTAVAGAASIPSPVVSIGRTATAAVVAAVASIPASGPTGAAQVTAAKVSGTATVPAVAVAAGGVALPVRVAGVASIPAVTVQASLSILVTPPVVAGVTSVPAVAPIIPGGAAVTPDRLLARARIPYPTVVVPAAPVTPSAPTGNWYRLMDIYREAAAFMAEDLAAPPVACPNDGEPLIAGPRGQLYCPFDGWQPS